MAMLAMASYALVTGGRGRMHKGRAPSRTKDCSTKSTAKGHSRKQEEVTQPVFRALSQGRTIEALKLFQQLPPTQAASCSARVLTILAKEPELGDTLTKMLFDVAGKFDS